MKKIYIAITYLLLTCFGLQAEEQDNVVRLTLKDAITLAQHQSVDAAVALNDVLLGIPYPCRRPVTGG